MSVDTCNDYYQLCYNSDSSQSRDDEYDHIADEEFPYQQYFSSPKVYHSSRPLHNGTEIHFEPYKDESCPLSPGSAIYSDLDTMKTKLQSSYLSDKLRKTSMENIEDKKFIEEAVSCLESLLGNNEENTLIKDNVVVNSLKSSKEHLTNDVELESSEVPIVNGEKDDININPSLSEINNQSDFHFEPDDVSCDSKYFHDENISSSGVSSYNHSPSSSYLFTNTSSQNLLNIEIDRLKNIASSNEPYSSNTYDKRHSLPKEIINSYSDITLCDEKLNLVSYDTNTRSSTPNGRKSPFIDLFKSKRYFDFDTQSYCRQKINKRLHKANFFCHFKKSSMKSVNLMEKHDSEYRIDGDVNDDMKIHHASPFVRTIFQYVESSSVEDIFSSSSFNINDSNSVPVFTCGGMRTLQENNKFNSLSRKCKKNQIIRTMERGQHDPVLVSSGRRISENSDFYISVIAYLDRIRRAKGTSLRRRPRHRRHKSDPGDSISTFLSEMSQQKYKQCTSSSDQLDDIRIKSPADENDSKCTLNQRFSHIHCSDPKTFKSQFSTSDSAINHRFSLCEDITETNKKVFSRKSRSLRNISLYTSRKKCLHLNESKRNSTDSSKLNESLLSNEDVFQEEKENIERMPIIKKELFPEKSSPKKSVLTENNANMRIQSPRRSVFSENFELVWPPLLTKTTPDELKTWLDSQELSPEDRQKLTEQLLLQLIQMGPAASHIAEKKSSSKNDLVNSTTSINENSYFHDVSDQSCSSEKSDSSVQNKQVNNKSIDSSMTEAHSIKSESQNTGSEKMNRTKKLFGSIRRNRRSKSLDWNRTQYSNDAYDSDSLKRKSKSIATKPQHTNSAQKMKRFSMIRSIFEPIKSPKVKKSVKSPINVKKMDTDSKVQCSYNGIVKKQNGTPHMNGSRSKIACNSYDDDAPKIVVNMRERPPRFDHSYVKESLSKNCYPNEELSLTSSSASSLDHDEQQHVPQKPSAAINENRTSLNDKNKSFKRSRSIDSITDEIKMNELNRKGVSRSADAIHEMKQHTKIAAALYQDIHDSGILHGSNGGPDGKSKNSDVIEVFISNSLDGPHIVEEVTSSEPSLNWNKVDCLNGSCNNCCVANKEADGSRIIVDVPHHLIPPEIASKSPINSPNVRRKGLLKKTPCLLQHPLIQGEKGEKGNDFTSADSGLSLSDETDYTQQQDVTNFSLIRETKTISNGNKNTSSVKNTTSDKNTPLSPTSDIPIVVKNTTTRRHSRSNSFHKTEILHRVDSQKTDGHNNIPHVITISQNHPADSNGHTPNEHKLKIISPILPKNKEKFFVKSSKDNCENTDDSNSKNDNKTNTIKCQRKTSHTTSYSISNQKEELKKEKKETDIVAPTSTVTVARVPPFNENKDTPEDDDSLEDVRIPPSKQNEEESEDLAVSELGKTFENTSNASSSCDVNKPSSVQNGMSMKKESRTPRAERKFDMVTRVNNDKSANNSWQGKHGLFMKQNSNEGNHTLDINSNIVYENQEKPRISKSNHNYENINYETVHGRSIVTNNDHAKQNGHVLDHNNDSRKVLEKGSYSKCSDKNKETHKNESELKDHNSSTNRADNSFEVNLYECDTRSSTKTATSKGNSRIDYKIVVENNTNSHNGPKETYNNASSDNEKVINSPPTPRRTRKILGDGNGSLNEKNSPLCTTNNKDNDKTYICQQNLRNQNCEFIKNNLKDEKPKKINNIDTSIKTNYGKSYDNCDMVQVTSPKGIRKDYNNNNENLKNDSTNSHFSVKPSNVLQMSNNYRTLNSYNGDIKTQNRNSSNELTSTTDRYKSDKSRTERNHEQNTILNNGNELSIRKSEKTPDENQVTSKNYEIHTRARSRTRDRSTDGNSDTSETYSRVRTRSRNSSADGNQENSDTYTRSRSRQRDRSTDNNQEMSDNSDIYTRARPRSRTSSIGSNSESNSNTLTRTRSRTRNRSADINPENSDVYKRASSRTRDRSSESNSENSEVYTRPPRTRSRTSSIGSNSENSDTLTRSRSRQRERSNDGSSETTETYNRVRTRSRNNSIGSNSESNSDTLTRSRGRQRDRIGNNTNISEVYSRPQSRSRGRSIDRNENSETYTRPRTRSRASSIESNSSEVDNSSYTRTRSRTRDHSSDKNSETARTYSRTRTMSRGNSFEKNQDSDSYNSLTRSRSRAHDRTINSNFENSEAYKRIKELARQRIASRSRNSNINQENFEKSEVVPRPWNRSFDDDVNNSNNSSESESYSRTSHRNLPNRNSISDSTISDSTMSDCTISDSERSVDDRDDEQVYRRRSRRNSLDEDGPRVRRYRSNDSGTNSPALTRRRDGKRESSRSSTPLRNNHYKNDSMLHNRNSSSIESLTSLQNSDPIDHESNSNHNSPKNNNNKDYETQTDNNDNMTINKRSPSIKKSNSDTNLDDCECGSTRTGSKLRRNNSKSGQNSHRSSLTDLTSSSLQNSSKSSSTNEEPTSPITRNKSKSDPSLHCSPYYYDWGNGDDSSSQNESQNQNGDSSVVTRRRNGANSSAESKRRHHSTGHSPDITVLLQHLICDIEEEEVVSSSEDQDESKKVDEDYKLQQLEAFNRNLNELITASADELNTFGIDLPNKPMRRTLSEDDIGLKLLRMQRLKRKNNCGEMQLTRKPSVIWAVVKKMEVSLVIQKDYGEPEIIKIEDFNVRRVNTYKDVEELAIDTYMKHLQLLDKQHLDLDTFDIKYLQMAEHKVPIGSPFDLSIVKIEDSFLPCRLCMKAKESWSLASLSYESLIPKSYLEKYVSLILAHHHAIFFGPSGTGKSYLAERIANLINYRMNEGKIPPIILKNVTPERWKTLLTNLAAEKREKAYVVILDGFSQRFIDSNIDIHEIIKVCDEHEPKPYIICTMTITPTTKIPAKWQLSFRWIWLSNHEEPIDGVLQRYLRRKFIQYGNQHLQRESFRIADWLTSVWRHINSFLNKFTSTDCSIGPTMFYECPPDILDAEEWFVDLWNYSITPYILHSVKQGLKQHGVRCEWEDPLGYILKSYPWVSEKVKKKMKLKRICMEDVDFSLHCHSEEEKQRLLDFLRQLEVMMFEDVEPGNNPRLKSYRKESSL